MLLAIKNPNPINQDRIKFSMSLSKKYFVYNSSFPPFLTSAFVLALTCFCFLFSKINFNSGVNPMHREVAQILRRSQMSLCQPPPLLTCYVTIVQGSKQRNLILVHGDKVNSRLYLDFTRFPINVLFVLRCPVECPPTWVWFKSF